MASPNIKYEPSSTGILSDLFVGEYKHHGVPELILAELYYGEYSGNDRPIDTIFSSSSRASSIRSRSLLSTTKIRPYKASEKTVQHLLVLSYLGVLVVVTPQRTDLILTSDIPHGEPDVLVFNGFDVKP